jgi:hypothetical protein
LVPTRLFASEIEPLTPVVPFAQVIAPRLPFQDGVSTENGTLLLDPKNIVISAAPAGLFPQFDLIDPHPTVGGLFAFGTGVSVLANGNVVVTNPNDDFGGTNAGAVYLFDGVTGALLSSLVGSNPDDQVGGGNYAGGVVPLSNSDYVIESPFWNHVRGAATWGNAITGISGTVSDANSLVGGSPGDYVGGSVTLSGRIGEGVAEVVRNGLQSIRGRRSDALQTRLHSRGRVSPLDDS